jgi:hypothetical protein
MWWKWYIFFPYFKEGGYGVEKVEGVVYLFNIF